MRDILAAAIAAVLVQPIVLAIRLLPALIASESPIYGVWIVVVAVLVVSVVFVILLGIPAFLLLRRFGHDGWFSLGTIGFLLGAVPSALVFWPRRLSGYSAGENWHGHFEHTYVNGEPTIYAWYDYLENVAIFGLHGLVGALVFFAIIRISRRRLVVD
jgi:hypothetical protein